MIAHIFKLGFGVRRSMLVLGVVVGGLAFPAATMAAKRPRPPCSPKSHATCQIKTTVISGPKGFKLTLLIQQGTPTGYGGRYPNSVTGILFNHVNSHATENDKYTFSGGGGSPLKFRMGKTKALQFTQITGTFAHSGGSINMTFHATGSPVRVRVPKGCTSTTNSNSGIKRTGTLSGSFTLHADKLGTIKQKSFKATISDVGWTCNPPTHGYDVQTVGVTPAWIDVFKNKTGSVSEEFDVTSGNGTTWSFDHKFTVTGLPSSDYSIKTTKNLKQATVNGADGITGSATYSSNHSSSHQTFGTMGGSLAAPFTSIGTVQAFPKSRSARQSLS